ncbi:MULTISPECIES: hypothetical protein [Moorena]|uniref:Uncharacterized protein n=1 Tax=Moorena producens (strain JHB) TaxID=1454205 RepID=A0A1D9G5W0_MOOP1|nr:MULTISPECIES: hypothetical protein [Moorena]AOY82914.1 hypothetical protein BJP36_26385 [Moorena producens JHB]NER86002.1 hypothetical protein [Moorena sp. SIO3A2]NES40079.1 hypothetical protein [Moorena sp. SIO2C4]
MADKSIKFTGTNNNSPILSGNVKGNIYNNTYNSEQKRNLAEAASEIQQLLEQLEKSYSTQTITGKLNIATKAIEHIESNPKLSDKIVNALKAGSIQALAQLLNHPASSFVIAALEEWDKN